MGNWYRVTKTINGRRYDYWQRTKRVGKSVKTENKYIGPAGSGKASAASTPHDPFAHARFGSPTFIPKTGYLPEAQRYVNEWGTVSYSDKRSAELYAADLEKGEGGTWRAERETPNGYWRAHRITTTAPAVTPARERSPTAPETPEDAMYQLNPTHNPDGVDLRNYKKWKARERAEDERIQYGNLKDRVARQKKELRTAKRKAKGLKIANPFLAALFKK
jgi:hypothetical protein